MKVCKENNPSTESIPPGREIALILMDKAQTSLHPWALDLVKNCDDVWQLLCREEMNIGGRIMDRIIPIVGKVQPEYLHLDEWPWASSVPKIMEPHRHDACVWLAEFRASSIPSLETALEEAVVWAKGARADACNPYPVEWLAEEGFLEEFVDTDLNEEGENERLVRDARVDGFEVKSGLEWLAQLGLLVVQGDVPVSPCTSEMFEIARDRLYAALHQKVHERAMGYFHPCSGWIQVRALSADEHARIREAAARILRD